MDAQAILKSAEHFLASHIYSTLSAAIGSSTLGTAFVLHYLEDELPSFISKEEHVLIQRLLSDLTRPKDVAACKAILEAIADRFPDAGDALFALYADDIIARVPSLKPYRENLIALLIGVDVAAKKAMENP
jgi:hypothetical protein